MGGGKVTMADKEERITIHQVLYPCKKCSINCNKNDWKNCDFYQNYISGMTRQEAIERMAKAICKQTNYQCSVCEVENNKEKCEEWIVFQYKTQAEAALNSLLEDKK